MLRNQVQEKDGGAKAGAVDRASNAVKLRWREGENAPCEMNFFCDAVVGNNTVYYKYSLNAIYAYHIPSSSWSPILDCPTKSGFAITVINGLLTAVGGYEDDMKMMVRTPTSCSV